MIYVITFKKSNEILDASKYDSEMHPRLAGIRDLIAAELSFFDFLLLKIFTGHNIENSSEKSRVWRHGNPFDSSGHTSLITPEHSKQKRVAQRYTSTISRQWLVVRML